MVVNKTFLDTFYLLELLKWNTDEEHPLTQNDLRKIADSQKLNDLGDAKTFHKRLITLASLCNNGNESKNWSLLYHGVEQDLLEGSSTPGTHVRKIHYKQPIMPAELDFIIHQIECSGLFDSERKDTLIELLIHMFGNKFYYDRYLTDNIFFQMSSTFHTFHKLIMQSAMKRQSLSKWRFSMAEAYSFQNLLLKFPVLKKIPIIPQI